MTTIAYDGNSIAIDGQVNCGSIIQSSDFDKSINIDGITYFCAGTISDYQLLPPIHRVDTKADLEGFFLKDGKVWHFADVDGVWFVCEAIPRSACGSGSMFALSAMAMGKSAEEAVKFASTLDVYTGGKIRVFKV